MREVDLIVVLSESVRKGQCVIASIPTIPFALECVPMIANVVTDTVPRELLWPVSTHLREAEDSHALII